MARIKQGSRYTNGIFTTGVDNKEYLILRNSINIPESGQDAFFTVEGPFLKRIDLISQRVYGRPDLGWVIMDVNSIHQPLFNLAVGQVLRIPPLNNVLEAIEKLNK
jgi:hypothetical protein